MRRNAFASLKESIENPVVPSSTTGGQIEQATSPLDFIPSAAPKKKRDRSWEKAHQEEVATFRGITPEVRQTLMNLAEMLDVAVNEVARVFLDYGISNYQSGQIQLSPSPKAQRMTLFSQERKGKSGDSNGWLKEEVTRIKKTDKRKKTDEHKPWEYRVSYRLPPSTKKNVKAIAERHSVPVGEVVLYFFNFSYNAYESGSLILTVKPKNAGNTLFS
jgi:hypothetical protein